MVPPCPVCDEIGAHSLTDILPTESHGTAQCAACGSVFSFLLPTRRPKTSDESKVAALKLKFASLKREKARVLNDARNLQALLLETVAKVQAAHSNVVAKLRALSAS